jgi:hypothetical protein
VIARYRGGKLGWHGAIARWTVAILVGIIVCLAMAILLGTLLSIVGLAPTFTTQVGGQAAQRIALSLTLWGGLIALVAAASGGWVAAEVAGNVGKRHAALLGGLSTLVATLLVLIVAAETVGPAADFRSAAVELGVIGVPDRAAEAAIRPEFARQVPSGRFLESVARSGLYATTVLVLVVAAGALGGIERAVQRQTERR